MAHTITATNFNYLILKVISRDHHSLKEHISGKTIKVTFINMVNNQELVLVNMSLMVIEIIINQVITDLYIILVGSS